MSSDNYYEILGLTGGATGEEIKKAYRRLALKWHPDKNPGNLKEADDRFKLIGEAYEVLSDPEKKSVYDRYGKSGLRSGAGDADFHFSSATDIFRQFFGTDDPFADFFGGAPRAGSRGGFGNTSGFGSFGFGFHDFPDFGGGRGGSSFSSFSSTSGGGGRGSYSRSSSSSVKTVNGKTVETRKVVENGKTTVERLENGRLISRTVNGQQVALADGTESDPLYIQ